MERLIYRPVPSDRIVRLILDFLSWPRFLSLYPSLPPPPLPLSFSLYTRWTVSTEMTSASLTLSMT